ncbi:hypothetical protein IWGMT90018_50420 [Mycobacterium kiyosense]|nr:hypothetical protein IWGMT90018_50420 [Mycobacterium kiyosense]
MVGQLAAGVGGLQIGNVKVNVAGLGVGRLGSLLGGFNLSNVLSSLQLGTGNLANLNLHSLGLAEAGTGRRRPGGGGLTVGTSRAAGDPSVACRRWSRTCPTRVC